MGTILQGKADQGQLLSLTFFAFWKKVPSIIIANQEGSALFLISPLAVEMGQT